MSDSSQWMRKIPVERAVGTVLCHDITEIVRGSHKGRAFKKGHVVRQEDIDHFLRLGKENLYVLDLSHGLIHENEAAERIARAVAGQGLELTEPSEGRINMRAAYQGLLKIDVERLDRVNSIENIVLATAHTNQEVAEARAVAGTRIVPLVIEEKKIQAVESLCSDGPLIQILPFQKLQVGMVTTGSEVYKGRIKDEFGPVVCRKFESLGCSLSRQVFVSDDIAMTVSAIENLIDEGADMVVVTGGMSVDPDDLSPSAIRASGGEVVSYGSPTFPGAMFMLAYRGGIPIVGLPGCVMYYHASVFDLIVPRLVAGDPVGREDIVKLGHGGFCAGCSSCRYPTCSFGKR
jgi:molybdenum cofactor synthesis domain-containing protein